jgi:hypothetical protein
MTSFVSAEASFENHNNICRTFRKTVSVIKPLHLLKEKGGFINYPNVLFFKGKSKKCFTGNIMNNLIYFGIK